MTARATPYIDRNIYHDSRILPEDLERELAFVRERHPGARPIVLTDQPWASGPDVVDYRRGATLADRPAAGAGVFVLAFDQDDVAARAAADVKAIGGVFYPIRRNAPLARYWHLNAAAREVLGREFEAQTAGGYAKFDDGDFSNIIQAIDITRAVEGAYLEIGSFRGSSGRVALHYLHRIGAARDCCFLDVFDGFVYDEAASSIDRTWLGTHVKQEGRDAVEARFAEFAGGTLRVRVLKHNVIVDPLPPGLERIAVANIDVDMYEAVLAAMRACAPRIAPGGIMIVEDAGHTPYLIGARLALDEFRASDLAAGFVPVYLESGQTFFIKR